MEWVKDPKEDLRLGKKIAEEMQVMYLDCAYLKLKAALWVGLSVCVSAMFFSKKNLKHSKLL